MGVFSALTTAVTGMTAQSYALENISGNIANARTTGYKRIDTTFSDLVPDTALNRQVGGSVASYSLATNTIQGDLQATRIDTNVAINGDGYFVVDQRSTGIGANMKFDGKNLYTRRGDFDFDANGYLVNGAGYYLKGFSIDQATGQLIGTQPNVIQIAKTQFPAKATAGIDYSANLPSYPKTNNTSTSTVPGAELLYDDSSTFAGTYADSAAIPGQPTRVISGTDMTKFLTRSIEGGSVTVYDALGQAVSVNMRWAKLDDGAPPATTGTWQLFVAENTSATGAGQVAYRAAGVTAEFGPTGQMVTPTNGIIQLPQLTIGGTAISTAASPINLTIGTNGLTQNGDVSGLIDARSIRQDGYTAGTLDRVSVNSEGQVMGVFSNGQMVALAQIATARFNADNSLKRLDGGAFEETVESGPPITGLGTSQLIGGNVEQSNTDIADEFSKMIVTQQAYSANTKVISTAQDMLSAVFNIIR